MATTPGAAPVREQRGIPPRAPRRPGDLVFSGASLGSGILIPFSRYNNSSINFCHAAYAITKI